MEFPKSLLLASLSGMLLCASCDDSASPTPSPSDRAISARLRATCPALPAARTISDSNAVAPIVTSNAPIDVLLSIYDTHGSHLVDNRYRMATTTYGGLDSNLRTNIGWDMKDAAGNPVPTGHYFLFSSFTDTLGMPLGADSACIGVVRAGS